MSGEADVTITACNGMSPRWMTSFGVHDVMISLLHRCGAERLIILVNAGRMKSAPETKGGPQRSLSPCFSWQVRGAPAIAIVGCLSLAVELRAGAGGDDPVTFIRESLCHLTSARPTAVNMGRAARELMEFAENESMEKNSEQLRERWGGNYTDSPRGLAYILNATASKVLVSPKMPVHSPGDTVAMSIQMDF